MVNWLIRLIRKIKNRKGEYEEMAQDTNISTIKGVYVNREISWLKFNELSEHPASCFSAHGHPPV